MIFYPTWLEITNRIYFLFKKPKCLVVEWKRSNWQFSESVKLIVLMLMELLVVLLLCGILDSFWVRLSLPLLITLSLDLLVFLMDHLGSFLISMPQMGKMLWSSIINARMAFPNEKWIILGDFNTSLSSMEKAGGMPVSNESGQDLADMINSLGLLNLDLLGDKFTWSNRRSGWDLIQVKLDKGIISPKWIRNASCRLNALFRIGSDHFQICLSISPLTGRKAFPSRFEKMWLLALDIHDNISKWCNVDI